MTAATSSLRRVGSEAVRFALVGIAANALDVALFWLLVDAGASPLVANPVSTALRLAVAFWLTRTWVFPHRQGRTALAEAAGFLALAALNVAAVQGTLWLALALSGGALPAPAATAVKVAAVVVTFGLRFFLSRRVVFRADRPGAEQPASGAGQVTSKGRTMPSR